MVPWHFVSGALLFLKGSNIRCLDNMDCLRLQYNSCKQPISMAGLLRSRLDQNVAESCPLASYLNWTQCSGTPRLLFILISEYELNLGIIG